MDEEIFVNNFFGHIVNTNSTTNFFSFDKERNKSGFNEIDMTSEFADLNINIKTLGEEINIELVVTMILKKIDLFIGHGHFSVIIFETSFIDNETTVTHHISTKVRFITFHGSGNTEIRPDFSTLFHILFCEVSSKGGFTSSGDSEIKGQGNGFSFYFMSFFFFN